MNKRLGYITAFLFISTHFCGMSDAVFASRPSPTVIYLNQKKPTPNPDDLKKLLKTNSCVGCDLRGADLQGRDLRGADLRNALLGEANFDRANLEKADFRQSKLFNRYALLESLRPANTDVEDIYSLYVILRIIPSTVKKVLITDNNQKDYPEVMILPVGAMFRNANLTEANFSGTLLRGMTFRDANLVRTDFSGADFKSKLDFLGANLEGANLEGVIVSNLFSVVIDYRYKSLNLICPNSEVLTKETFQRGCRR